MCYTAAWNEILEFIHLKELTKAIKPAGYSSKKGKKKKEKKSINRKLKTVEFLLFFFLTKFFVVTE